jgi:hypothetical protein
MYLAAAVIGTNKAADFREFREPCFVFCLRSRRRVFLGLIFVGTRTGLTLRVDSRAAGAKVMRNFGKSTRNCLSIKTITTQCLNEKKRTVNGRECARKVILEDYADVTETNY